MVAEKAVAEEVSPLPSPPTEPSPATTAQETTPPKPPRPKRRRRKVRKLIPPDAYEADQGHVSTTKWLAFFLVLAVLFSVVPAVLTTRLDLAAAAGWARLVLIVGLVQVGYVLWMVNRPDWASVWVVMLVFAAVAAIYAVATAIVTATPADKPMMLGMEDVRRTARIWTVAVLAVMSLAAYLCGRVSSRWHRMFELEMAGRRKDGP